MPVCGNYLFFELPKKIVLNPKDGLRPGGTAQIGVAEDGAGEQQEAWPHPVALADGILDQITPVREGGELAVDSGGGQIQLCHQALQRPFRLVIHEALQNLQGAEDAGYLFFCHKSAAPFWRYHRNILP